jgi:hypothetical protein
VTWLKNVQVCNPLNVLICFVKYKLFDLFACLNNMLQNMYAVDKDIFMQAAAGSSHCCEPTKEGPNGFQSGQAGV